MIVRRAGKRPPVAEIMRRAEALEARGFVIGLPLDGNGDETPRSTEARAVADELSSGRACRSSSSTSGTRPPRRCERSARWAGRREDRKGDVDALAATVLLQQALDERDELSVDAIARRDRRCARSLFAARGCSGSGARQCA